MNVTECRRCDVSSEFDDGICSVKKFDILIIEEIMIAMMRKNLINIIIK